MFSWIDGSSGFWTGLISALLVVAHISICVAALGVIPGNRRPSTGMTWLILILAVPFFGFIAFLFFGSTHVEKRRHDKQAHVNELVRERTAAIASGDATSVEVLEPAATRRPGVERSHRRGLPRRYLVALSELSRRVAVELQRRGQRGLRVGS